MDILDIRDLVVVLPHKQVLLDSQDVAVEWEVASIEGQTWVVGKYPVLDIHHQELVHIQILIEVALVVLVVPAREARNLGPGYQNQLPGRHTLSPDQHNHADYIHHTQDTEVLEMVVQEGQRGSQVARKELIEAVVDTIAAPEPLDWGVVVADCIHLDLDTLDSHHTGHRRRNLDLEVEALHFGGSQVRNYN